MQIYFATRLEHPGIILPVPVGQPCPGPGGPQAAQLAAVHNLVGIRHRLARVWPFSRPAGYAPRLEGQPKSLRPLTAPPGQSVDRSSADCDVRRKAGLSAELLAECGKDLVDE